MPWTPEKYQSSAAFGEGQLDEPFIGPETPIFQVPAVENSLEFWNQH